MDSYWLKIKLITFFCFVIISHTLYAQPKDYYSYKNGDWMGDDTWTTDPSGTNLIHPSPLTPGSSDNVYIINGRTITVTSTVSQISTLRIDEGAILDVGGITGLNFGTVSGKGILKISAPNASSNPVFPTGTYTNFVSAGGGTVMFYNCNGAIPTNVGTVYNNLYFYSSGGTWGMRAESDLSVNGELKVYGSTGTITLSIGDNTTSTARTISVTGTTNVLSGGILTVSTTSAGTKPLHNLILYGDLNNSGTIDLNLNAAYGANNTGAATIYFKGNENAIATIDVNTEFYNFEIDKGVDQSYTVDVMGVAAVSPFKGNDAGRTITITSGTLRLGLNVTVAQLTSGTNYLLSKNSDNKGALWIDGATVNLATSAATLSLYGGFIATRGSFGPASSSIILNQAAVFDLRGTATVNITQIYAVSTTLYSSYIQTGGTVNITGPQSNTAYPLFYLPYTNNVFNVSGGIINIKTPATTGAGANCGIVINSSAGNYVVDGGTVNVEAPGTSNFIINSTASFGNMVITKISGTGGQVILDAAMALAANPLTIVGNLTLSGSNTPKLNANGKDVYIGGDFLINTNTDYTTGTNTTVFNGTSAQLFTNNSSTQTINSLKVDKSTGTLKMGSNITLNADLNINSGTLDDNGYTITVKGNVTNSDTHVSTGSGKIAMTNTGIQQLKQTYYGIGFGTIEVNTAVAANNYRIITDGDVIVNKLIYNDGVINIGNNKFTIGNGGLVNGNGTAFSETKMFLTSGSI